MHPHSPTYPHTQEKKERERERERERGEKDNCTIIQRAKPDKLLSLSCSLPLMHFHHSLLILFPPSSFVSTFPTGVGTRYREVVLAIFPLCEWTRPITSLFNEHVVFSCSAHSPNKPSQHWQISGKGIGLCVLCVRTCVCEGEGEK